MEIDRAALLLGRDSFSKPVSPSIMSQSACLRGLMEQTQVPFTTGTGPSLPFSKSPSTWGAPFVFAYGHDPPAIGSIYEHVPDEPPSGRVRGGQPHKPPLGQGKGEAAYRVGADPVVDVRTGTSVFSTVSFGSHVCVSLRLNLGAFSFGV
mgnify:CR=1 FL=1